jgi:peptide/nickel transport system substrate-binding protein
VVHGETVTAQDIEFWMNLLEAEKTKWAAYVPGAFPDNVTSYSVESPTKFVMHLNKSYSTNWFTYNELSQITPLPMAWDVTASGPSSCATSVSACAGVYAYLHKLSSQESTYTSSPIWAVVDGPWKLSAFSTSGQVTLVPNPDYSGPVKPHLAAFEELPFTSASSEFSNLKAGNTLDVGYLPLADSAQETAIAALGYQLSPWISWSINYFPLNFNNPKVGAIFKQLYVRQAFQELVDQPLYIKQAMAGKGAPTYGPVPVAPKTADASPSESSNPYPYNPSRAKALLTSHGWRLNSSGVLQCSDPGSGSNQCGPGVAGGATMDFNLQYASGLNHLTTIMEAMKSGFSQVGIVLNLSTAPFDTVIGTAIPCTPSQSTCSWEMENWGGGWSYAPDYYPTGGEIFGTGAGSNSGSYSDPETDSLIAATHTDSSLSSLYKYENYLAEQLPVVWQPNPPYYLTEIKDNLHGVTPQNPVLALTPENWYFTKS